MGADLKLDEKQADRVAAALLAAPVSEQQAARKSIEAQHERKPRGWAAGLWLAVAALVGFKS